MPMATVSTGDVIQAAHHNSIVNALKGTTGENLTAFTKGTDLASASALVLGTDGNYWHVTGTVAITSISSLPAGTVIKLEFDGALLLTHNATTLILQGATSYTTVAGDVFEFTSEGSGNWRETGRGLSASTTTIASTFGATPSLTLSTTNGAGTGTGFIRRNATIALFDTTAARAVAFGDVGTTGGVNFASPRDHGHAFVPSAAVVASTNNVLLVASTNGNLSWGAQAFVNPMTSVGDLIVGGTAGAVTRQAIVPSTANVLQVASTNGNLKWATAPSAAVANGTLISRYIFNGTVNVTNAASGYTDFGGSFTTSPAVVTGDQVHIVVQTMMYKDAAGYGGIFIDRGGTKLPAAGTTGGSFMARTVNHWFTGVLDFWDTPTTGTVTYKPQIFSSDANTATAGGGDYCQFMVEVWR